MKPDSHRSEHLRPEPLRIEPIFNARIWGSRSLAPFFPEKKNLDPPIGEAWLTSLDCKIANGPFAGQTLGESWNEMSSGWRGAKFEGNVNFPLLLKFLFPTDKLSIQVHPDDAYATANEADAGGCGKTEMWHVVSAEPGARLLAGLKPGVTKEKFIRALADNTLEDLFQSHEVHAGDTFFLPAGMPHTLGPHMVICEVQQYSDLTYRVYDYGRVDASGKPRELHLEKALDVTRFGSILEPRVPANPQLTPSGKKLPWTPLVECPYFVVTKFEFDEYLHVNLGHKVSDHFDLWVFLEGEGQISWIRGEFSYKPGDCWFVPAEFVSHSYRPRTKTSILKASPRNVRPDTSIR